MKPTKTRGMTNLFKAPANWNPATDGECGDLEVRRQFYGTRGIIDHVSTWKPSADELAHLNRGGVIEMSLLTPVQPPASLSVVDPVDTVIVDDRPGTKALTVNEEGHGLGYDEHGPATP
jgi:hypothetical protein